MADHLSSEPSATDLMRQLDDLYPFSERTLEAHGLLTKLREGASVFERFRAGLRFVHFLQHIDRQEQALFGRLRLEASHPFQDYFSGFRTHLFRLARRDLERFQAELARGGEDEHQRYADSISAWLSRPPLLGVTAAGEDDSLPATLGYGHDIIRRGLLANLAREDEGGDALRQQMRGVFVNVFSNPHESLALKQSAVDSTILPIIEGKGGNESLSETVQTLDEFLPAACDVVQADLRAAVDALFPLMDEVVPVLDAGTAPKSADELRQELDNVLNTPEARFLRRHEQKQRELPDPFTADDFEVWIPRLAAELKEEIDLFLAEPKHAKAFPFLLRLDPKEYFEGVLLRFREYPGVLRNVVLRGAQRITSSISQPQKGLKRFLPKNHTGLAKRHNEFFAEIALEKGADGATLYHELGHVMLQDVDDRNRLVLEGANESFSQSIGFRNKPMSFAYHQLMVMSGVLTVCFPDEMVRAYALKNSGPLEAALERQLGMDEATRSRVLGGTLSVQEFLTVVAAGVSHGGLTDRIARTLLDTELLDVRQKMLVGYFLLRYGVIDRQVAVDLLALIPVSDVHDVSLRVFRDSVVALDQGGVSHAVSRLAHRLGRLNPLYGYDHVADFMGYDETSSDVDNITFPSDNVTLHILATQSQITQAREEIALGPLRESMTRAEALQQQINQAIWFAHSELSGIRGIAREGEEMGDGERLYERALALTAFPLDFGNLTQEVSNYIGFYRPYLSRYLDNAAFAGRTVDDLEQEWSTWQPRIREMEKEVRLLKEMNEGELESPSPEAHKARIISLKSGGRLEIIKSHDDTCSVAVFPDGAPPIRVVGKDWTWFNSSQDGLARFEFGPGAIWVRHGTTATVITITQKGIRRYEVELGEPWHWGEVCIAPDVNDPEVYHVVLKADRDQWKVRDPHTLFTVGDGVSSGRSVRRVRDNGVFIDKTNDEIVYLKTDYTLGNQVPCFRIPLSLLDISDGYFVNDVKPLRFLRDGSLLTKVVSRTPDFPPKQQEKTVFFRVGGDGVQRLCTPDDSDNMVIFEDRVDGAIYGYTPSSLINLITGERDEVTYHKLASCTFLDVAKLYPPSAHNIIDDYLLDVPLGTMILKDSDPPYYLFQRDGKIWVYTTSRESATPICLGDQADYPRDLSKCLLCKNFDGTPSSWILSSGDGDNEFLLQSIDSPRQPPLFFPIPSDIVVDPKELVARILDVEGTPYCYLKLNSRECVIVALDFAGHKPGLVEDYKLAIRPVQVGQEYFCVSSQGDLWKVGDDEPPQRFAPWMTFPSDLSMKDGGRLLGIDDAGRRWIISGSVFSAGTPERHSEFQLPPAPFGSPDPGYTVKVCRIHESTFFTITTRYEDLVLELDAKGELRRHSVTLSDSRVTPELLARREVLLTAHREELQAIIRRHEKRLRQMSFTVQDVIHEERKEFAFSAAELEAKVRELLHSGRVRHQQVGSYLLHLDGSVAPRNLLKTLGASVEHRAYEPGDDLRYYDHKASAKTGKDYVRVQPQNVRKHAHLLVELTGALFPEAFAEQLYRTVQNLTADQRLRTEDGDYDVSHLVVTYQGKVIPCPKLRLTGKNPLRHCQQLLLHLQEASTSLAVPKEERHSIVSRFLAYDPSLCKTTNSRNEEPYLRKQEADVYFSNQRVAMARIVSDGDCAYEHHVVFDPDISSIGGALHATGKKADVFAIGMDEEQLKAISTGLRGKKVMSF